MSCPCGLSQERVVDLDQRDRVVLIGGKCQNPLADGSDGICGKALGAHPLAQGNFFFVKRISSYSDLIFDEITIFFLISDFDIHSGLMLAILFFNFFFSL
jgi:hypothetical protein